LFFSGAAAEGKTLVKHGSDAGLPVHMVRRRAAEKQKIEVGARVLFL